LPSADKPRQEALALPLDERAALAKDLLLSLDEPTDVGADQAWADELKPSPTGRRLSSTGRTLRNA
jgi:hypothetical protein